MSKNEKETVQTTLPTSEEPVVMTNVQKEDVRAVDLRAIFRPDPSQIYINRLPKHLCKEDHFQKRVRVSMNHAPNNVWDHLEIGWEFVCAPGKNINDRTNSITFTEKDNVNPEPIVVTSQDGNKSYWMEIPKAKYYAHQEKLRQGRIESGTEGKSTFRDKRFDRLVDKDIAH